MAPNRTLVGDAGRPTEPSTRAQRFGAIGFLVRKLFGRIGLCAAATFFAYCLASWSFDPLAELRAQQPVPPPEVIAARADRLALDLPIPIRFLHWAAGVATGDFGTTVGGRPVADELWTRTGTSLRLFVLGSALAIGLGIVLGVRSALSRRHRSGHLSLLTTLIVLSVPVFVLGTLLKIGWLPINSAAGTQILFFSGEYSPGVSGYGGAALLDRLRHLVLPTLCIAIPQLAYFSRYQRAAALEISRSDFVRAARGKGLGRRAAFRRHGLRLALVPMASLFAFSFGIHLAGGVFTERVFGWHGLGDWVMRGIHDHDANIVAAVTLLLAAMVAAAGLIADIATAFLDPRTRVSR